MSNNKTMAPGLDQQTTTVADSSEPPSKRKRTYGPADTSSLKSFHKEISPPSQHRRISFAGACSPPTDGVARRDVFAKLNSIDRGKNLEGRKGRGGVVRPINPLDIIDLTGEEPVFLGVAESQIDPKPKNNKPEPNHVPPRAASTKAIPSPFQLTFIRDLPASENMGAVGIMDILGDVMIQEVWIFNYLIDLDWVMSQFDPDMRDMVDIKVVHGSWRKADGNNVRLEEQSKRYPNVKIICAYMPEPFGTHHSKIMILFRHGDLAQIVIHTSNMIEFDWTNMTQGLWRSPLLPLIASKSKSSQTRSKVGDNFKKDILLYFANYEKSRTGGLTESLKKYSFDEVKAVFIGSVPGRFHVDGRGEGELWGWMALKRILSNTPLRNDPQDQEKGDTGKIVVQISSIATLGQTDTWLSPVFYRAITVSRNAQVSPSLRPKPKLSIIFPTAEEVRNSLNGYNSGKAIHIRIQSNAQQKQLGYLRQFLCHWDPSPPAVASDQSSSSPSTTVDRVSGRSRAAPHIKTYTRFSDKACTKIDWAMLTSANLSIQAWGSGLGNSSGRLMGPGEGEVRISSYEAGVVVYPELFKECEEDVEMVPVFKKDIPDVDQTKRGKIVGLRMAYDLPIKAYGKTDLPWCATMSYGILDCMGQSWEGN